MDKLDVCKELYGQGEFETAFLNGSKYIDSDEVKQSELYLFLVKCCINMSETPLNKKSIDNMVSYLWGAFSNSENLEELFFVVKEILSEVFEKKERDVVNFLAVLIEDPTFENLKEYDDIIAGYTTTEHAIIGGAGRSPIVQQILTEKELSWPDFYQSYCQEIIEHIKNRKALAKVPIAERAISRKIFENAVAKFEENRDVNIDFAKKVVEVLLQEFMVAELLASYASKHLEIDDNNRLVALKLQAEILDYMLDATVLPNGKPFSLVQSYRDKDIEKLSSVYNEITKLDSDFITPKLPNLNAYTFVVNKNKSGGCYVATAVYGSYDCPEVWTLRRFRDNILEKSFWGRLFILFYYAISPTLVKWFGETQWFRNMWKPILDNKVKKLNLNGVEDTPYNDRQW